jgi:hypothetical protein
MRAALYSPQRQRREHRERGEAVDEGRARLAHLRKKTTQDPGSTKRNPGHPPRLNRECKCLCWSQWSPRAPFTNCVKGCGTLGGTRVLVDEKLGLIPFVRHSFAAVP